MLKRTSLTLALAGLFVGGVAQAALGRNACTMTSKAARNACQNSAKDDFSIASGICTNASDSNDRNDCRSDANQSLRDSKAECGDQFDAREDLCAALGQAPYDPVIDPANFLSPQQTAASPNPYFPLIPGTTWIYKGPGETITVTVTDKTRQFIGVTATVVTDTVVNEQGELSEDTVDFYAQDGAGNVWYFGEITKELEGDEVVSIDGAWKAGVGRAKPGIIMEAAPVVGDVYRQEFSLANAEDAAEITSTTGTESVPAASCSGNCVVTRDFTPLNLGGDEQKYYAPGVGLILEIDTGGERFELMSVTP